MEVLTEEAFDALEFAYNQGYIDAQSNDNHYENIIKYWFGMPIKITPVAEEKDE